MSTLFVIWFGAWIAYSRQIPPEKAWEIPAAASIAIVVSAALHVAADLVRRIFRGAILDGDRSFPSRGNGLSRVACLVFLGFLAFTIPELKPAVTLPVLFLALSFCPFRDKGAVRFVGRYFRPYGRSAWICLIAGVIYWLYWEIEPYIQFDSFPAYGAAALAEWLGYESGNMEKGISLTRFGVTALLGNAPRHAYLFPIVLALAIQTAALCTIKVRPVFKTALFCFLAGSHFLYREAVVLGSLVHRFETEPMSGREMLFFEGLAFCPLFVICLLVLTAASDRLQPLTRSCAAIRSAGSGRSGFPAILCASGAALLVFFLIWTPPGEAGRGRVAVDGIHSEWEWTDIPLDRQLFGTKTTYNFVSLIRLLRQYFPVVDNVPEGVLDRNLLDRYDVWILKTPTREYTPLEREAVRRYVEEGGSVWLIGEHTDIFGINTFLNSVAEQFGIRFVNDAADDDISVPGRDHQLWSRSGKWHHPIVDRVPEFLFATSCSIDADPLRCRPVMTGSALFSDSPDYSSITFFGDMRKDSTEPYGRFHQCVSARVGKGRVVAFSDSTVFSSFSMQMKGKPELAVGTVNWLNHTNGSSLLPGILLSAAIAAMAAGMALFSRKRGLLTFATALSIVVGAALGLGGARLAAEAWAETYPEASWTCKRTAFLPRSGAALPFRRVIQHDEVSPQVFSTFYVWFQKADVLPFIVDSLDEADEFPLIVVLGDGVPFTAAQLEFMEDYIEKGGCLWVLEDSPRTVGQLLGLAPFRAACRIAELDEQTGDRTRAFDELHGRWLSVAAPDFGVTGLEPFLTAEDGTVIHGMKKAGGGTLVLTTEPALFSNASMGSPTDIPTETRFALFEVQWATIDCCLGP